jgi:hypothetical protein
MSIGGLIFLAMIYILARFLFAEIMTSRTAIVLIIIALFFCLLPFFVSMERFDSFLDTLDFVESLPEFVQQVVGTLILMPLLLLHGFSFAIGTGILAILLWRIISRFETLQIIALPLFSIVWLALQAAPFLSIPAGESIRPMGWTAFAFIAAVFLIILSVYNAIAAMLNGKSKIISLASICLSAVIITIPALSLNAVAAFKGLTLSP